MTAFGVYKLLFSKNSQSDVVSKSRISSATLWNVVNNLAKILDVVMELNNFNAEKLSLRGETSSLRTQLIEAQILDSQLGTDDKLIDSLVADGSQYDSNVRYN